MRTILLKIYTVWVLLVFTSVMVIFLPGFLIPPLFGPKGVSVTHFFIKGWSWIFSFLNVIPYDIIDRHKIIGDVRGRGLMIGVELVRNRQTKERATTERDRIVHECFKRGLLVLGAGQNSIRLSPPLVLTKEQADTAIKILDEAISAVL